MPTPANSVFRWQNLLWFLPVFVCIGLLVVLAPVLTPFLLALMLGYILNPGVDWLTRRQIPCYFSKTNKKKNMPRWLAALLMILAMLLLFVLLTLVLIPILQKDIVLLMQKLPALAERLNNDVAPRLQQWFGWKLQFDVASIKKVLTAQWLENREDWTDAALQYARSGGSALLTLLGLIFLVPFVLFYVLLDWPDMWPKLAGLIPRRWIAGTTAIVREIDDLLAQFMRGQIAVMCILACYYALGLALAGFETGVPIGVLTGLLIFIPYLGFALGLTLALLAAVLQFPGWYGLIAVGVVYGLGQLIESLWLTPRLVGERIGLHPLGVIFALLAFGQLFGFFGVLLALPASAALLVGMRHLKTNYLASDFYKK